MVYKSNYFIIKKALIYVCPCVLLFYSSCVTTRWTNDMTSSIFGKKIKLESIIHKYKHEAGGLFQWDVYSITIYKITEKDNDYIKNQFDNIKNIYPIKPDFRHNWNVLYWKDTPMENEDKELFYRYCLTYLSSIEIREYFDNAINEKNNYYCGFYKLSSLDSKFVPSLDFFVYIPDERVLIMIENMY